ncbi:MAG: DUF2344 domain-containing protein [Parasporobacterium sp.]|nr:DUF2344 domain-containing protein [Parasporobacterium sp.]
MRIRIKFTKNEIVKYLGHLDIMRSFQKCFNRADIKMTYSEGFNPHQKMNFALPLGVGISSRAEYLDAEIADGQDPADICRRLGMAAGIGFDVIAVRELEDNADKGMASVRYASYEVLFDNAYDLNITGYLSRDKIFIQKKTKTGIKDVDVKAILVDMNMTGRVLSILMKAGSENNLKPELIAADILTFNGVAFSRDMISITRIELYGPDIKPLIDYQTK